MCGLYPVAGRRTFACDFLPETQSVAFGRRGGLLEVRSAGLGFALVRREGLAAVRAARPEPGPADDPDRWFCDRARDAGFPVVADTAVRLWRVGPYRYGWEDAGRDPDRFADYTYHVAAPAGDAPIAPAPPADLPRHPLRGRPAPLPAGFPRFGLYVTTYPANRACLDDTLAGLRASDWGAEPTVLTQPADWPPGESSGAANYKRALEAAAADGCDFALVLEDDVRVNRHLRANLAGNPLVRGDQCDYLGLYIPDLIADPWERCEPHLGYRLARPRYSGANRGWERNRVWGVQGVLFSRRLVVAMLARWDRLGRSQDTRVLSVCNELQVPLWYTAPCLVEHVPRRSAFGTPTAYAPDFDPGFRLPAPTGFRPPDGMPGRLTRAEGELLWRVATGRDVLVVGDQAGQLAVCVAQSARRVVSAGDGDTAEATEWVRRFGLSDRVDFAPGGRAWRGAIGANRFGLVVVDAGVIEPALDDASDLLELRGLVAINGYPDPVCPGIRPAVDRRVRERRWVRAHQTDFVGVFQT